MKIRQLVETTYGNDINLSSKRLVELPNNLPQTVTGKFWCNRNKLTSLEYCPSYVGGNFYCYNNRLTSLNFCPSEVGGDFYCHRNKLTSLEDIHKQIKKIGGDFYCHDNKIKSHILGLMLVEIGGDIVTKLDDRKEVDEILNKWKNQGRKGALGCQRELIAAGYKELAQL